MKPISQKDHAERLHAGDDSPRVVNFGSFDRPKYVAWTLEWEGPGRFDYAAALADLRDKQDTLTPSRAVAYRTGWDII